MLKGNRLISLYNYMEKIVISLGVILMLSFFLVPAAKTQGKDPNIWCYDIRDIFYDIAYIDDDCAVVVGAMGRILTTHKTYKTLWSVSPSGTTELLTSLSFVDARNGWAAGHGGIILHTTDGGRTWEIQRESSTENQPLFDICFPSQKTGYACGNFETLIKTTDGGKTWRKLSVGLDEMFDAGLFGLYFTDEMSGYAVGEFGGIIQTTDGGKTWKLISDSAYQGTFFGIIPLSNGSLLAHGVSGKIMRTEDNGITWQDIPSNTSQRLFRGAFNGKELVLVGSSGTLLVSHDLGKRFIPSRHDRDVTSFAGVCVNPAGEFICVGERGTIYPVTLHNE